MNRSIGLLPYIAGLCLSLHAAVPPAPKLLPKDTLFFVTVPDWTQASGDMGKSPAGQLWADPSMKPFRDRFDKGFQEKVLGELEKQLGVKASEYADLIRGQFSLAVIQNNWKGADGTLPGFLLVIDSRDKSEQLKTKLQEVRRKLADAKKPVKTEKIRDTEFSVVTLDLPDDAPGEDDEDEKPDAANGKPATSGKKQNLLFGQVDSALLVADSAATLEKVMAGMGGGAVASLSEEPAFQSSESAWFRQTFAYGWAHVTPLVKVISSKLAEDAAGSDSGIDAKAALKAVGLEGLKTVSMAWNMNSDGSTGVVSFAVPEAQRLGLFKMLALTAKESGPTPFVPADAIKFQRWRLDGKKMWATLEETLAAAAPPVNGFFQMMVAQAGKDKDPSFDLKKSVVGNLGDDIVSYSKAPKGKTMEELMSPPTLMLIGSSDANALSTGLKAAMGSIGAMSGAGAEEIKDREFNGKKIMAVRTGSGPGGKSGRTEMASSAGYMAVSSTPAVLEEFLRSAESPGRSLKDDRTLASAAEKVGGMGTGMFGYENQRETMRSQWEFLRSDGLSAMMGDGDEGWGKVFDFKLLPDFEKVSKYFGIAVFSGSTDAQGTHFRFFSPNPK